jgi:Alw26I/Eco31I/Esp3I family type II restriction endonuclease
MRENRLIQPEFLEYQEFIVSHPNYKGLPFKRKQNGEISWLATKKSEIGKRRLDWWHKKCEEHQLPIKPGCLKKIALEIHPTKEKPCQICGTTLFLNRVYPSGTLRQRFSNFLKLEIEPYREDILTILSSISGNLAELLRIFDLPEDCGFDKEGLLLYVKINLIPEESHLLSSGCWSNPPDRFDGFHSDNNCCRSKSDKGRNPDNLKRYGVDRRAWEKWADGNHVLANKLMNEYRRCQKKYICPMCNIKKKMTADHIGPIALGFQHRPKFQPMCKLCNSAKNKYLSHQDVTKLVNDEKDGEQVISWHSKPLWDLLKGQISDDRTAADLSTLMSDHLQNCLLMFALIFGKTGKDFLRSYLKICYFSYDYEFRNFDPMNLGALQTIPIPMTNDNRKKQVETYYRVAFRSLEHILEDSKRRGRKLPNEDINILIGNAIESIKNRDIKEADDRLKRAINETAKYFASKSR